MPKAEFILNIKTDDGLTILDTKTVSYSPEETARIGAIYGGNANAMSKALVDGVSGRVVKEETASAVESIIPPTPEA